MGSKKLSRVVVGAIGDLYSRLRYNRSTFVHRVILLYFLEIFPQKGVPVEMNNESEKVQRGMFVYTFNLYFLVSEVRIIRGHIMFRKNKKRVIAFKKYEKLRIGFVGFSKSSN